MAFFVDLGFARFVSEPRSSSRRYPGKKRRDFPYPLSGAFGRMLSRVGGRHAILKFTDAIVCFNQFKIIYAIFENY